MANTSAFKRRCSSCCCSTFLFVTIISLLECLAVKAADDIRCYTCSGEWTVKRCLDKNVQQTCGFGEICYTTVTRGGFQSVKYDKGCLERNHCFDLQSLNSRKDCKRDPSICVYCCTDDLCNTGSNLGMTSKWTVTMTTVIIFLFLTS